MDNVTHGLAGMLMADVAAQYVARRRGRVVSTRVRRAAVVLGLVAAEFPDSDLVYSGPLVGMGPLGYLLHHRGHTHTLIWATISAVVLWGVTRWWLGRDRRADRLERTMASTPLLLLALAGTWSHLLLDFTNSYGVHPFWPFDDRWFYGDAVFIVEPWLWLVAIPPLLWGARSRGGRVVLTLLGVVILAASWFTGQVAREVAIVLTVGAALWIGVQVALGARGTPSHAWSGVLLWGLVTLGFFSASQVVRAEVTARAGGQASAAGDVVLDVVLNPAPADPTCWSTLVATRSSDGATYRLTSGVVAPFAVRTLAACEARYGFARVGGDVLSGLPTAIDRVAFAGSATVAWRRTWSAPVTELQRLVRERCEVAAALRFMRTPVWMIEASTGGDRLALTDARYGTSGGFNALSFPAAGGCTLAGKWIPPWIPPRAELIGLTGAQ
jgi:inner membrane protein